MSLMKVIFPKTTAKQRAESWLYYQTLTRHCHVDIPQAPESCLISIENNSMNIVDRIRSSGIISENDWAYLFKEQKRAGITTYAHLIPIFEQVIKNDKFSNSD